MSKKKKTKVIRLSDQIAEPYHEAVHTDKRNVLMTSGRIGAKSSGGAIIGVVSAISKPTAVMFMRKNHNKLEGTVYKEVLRAFKRLGIPKKDYHVGKKPMFVRYTHPIEKWESTIYFTGSDSDDDTKGFIDDNHYFSRLIIDEVNEFFSLGGGEEEINNIIATFIRGNDQDDFKAYYMMNPPRNPYDPANEWANKVRQRPNWLCLHSTYLEIPVDWVGKAMIEEAQILKEYDEDMYNWLWLGQPSGLEENIYYMFDNERHINKFDPALNNHAKLQYVGIGVDYGTVNATTFQAFGIDYETKTIQGIDEFYHSGKMEGRKSTSWYAKALFRFVEKVNKKLLYEVSFIVVDPSASGFIEEIRAMMPHLHVVPGNNKIDLGIARIQRLMALDAIKLSSTQVKLIEEVRRYSYDENSIERGVEKPLQEDDHAPDAMRYIIMYLWQYARRMLPMIDRMEKNE